MTRAERRRAVLSVLMAGAQALAALAGAVAMLLLTRTMGPAAFGQAMVLVAAATLGAVAAGANLEGAAIRVLNAWDAPLQAGFLRYTRRIITVGTGVSVAICTLLWLFGAAALPEMLAVVAAIPALAMLRATARQGAALGAPGGAVAIRILARPLTFLGLAVVSCAASLTPPAWILAAALAAAAAVGVLLQLAVLRPVLRSLPPAAREVPGARWLRMGLVLAPALLLQELFRDLVMVAAGTVLPAPDLGVLAIALTLAALPGLAVAAVDIATGPRIARLAAANRASEVSRALAEAARLRMLGLCCALPGLALILPPALHFAGAPMASTPVWALVLVPVVRAVLGNPAMLLTALGHADSVGRSSAAAAGLTALAVAGAGAGWGATGAAIAAAGGAGAGQVLLWIACMRLGGPDCSVRVLFRPLPRMAQP